MDRGTARTLPHGHKRKTLADVIKTPLNVLSILLLFS